MTSLRYSHIFCLEFQKIDGTEYLMGSTELAIFWKLLNLEACNLVGEYKIENKLHFVRVKFSILGLEIGLRPKK